MLVRALGGSLIIGLCAAIAVRRVAFLVRMIASGQPSPGRLDNAPKRALAQVVEVFGQQRLLKWSVPGAAHFLVFWGFVILGLTIVEAVGALFDVNFHLPIVGKWRIVGFAEDFFGVAVLVGLLTFSIIRYRNTPAKLSRSSRFYGSHTGPAWVILGMISLVILTMFGIRAAQLNTGVSPWQDHPWAPFFSKTLSYVIEPLGHTANERIEDVMVLGQIGVVFGFLVLVTYIPQITLWLPDLMF